MGEPGGVKTFFKLLGPQKRNTGAFIFSPLISNPPPRISKDFFSIPGGGPFTGRVGAPHLPKKMKKNKKKKINLNVFSPQDLFVFVYTLNFIQAFNFGGDFAVEGKNRGLGGDLFLKGVNRRKLS